MAQKRPYLLRITFDDCFPVGFLDPDPATFSKDEVGQDLFRAFFDNQVDTKCIFRLIPIRLQVYTFRVAACGGCAASLQDAPLALSSPRCRPGYPAEGWVVRLECKSLLGA